MYAIVDIETTGGGPSDGRIIEIAIVLHNGAEIVDSYSTLVNPEIPVPTFITGLTGISNSMVTEAPLFSEVSGKIMEFLEGRHFIAHNVGFDYHYLKEEFRRCGMSFRTNRACTIRLSREIFPGQPSYSLGKLCGNLGIHIDGRHRAMGDAMATARLFSLLMQGDSDRALSRMLKHGSGEINLPPYLPVSEIKKLPQQTGVYLFRGKRDEVIYVGKAINIRNRVNGHFASNSLSRQKKEFIDRIYKVDFILTGSDHVATFLEASLIRKHWPRYNNSLKVPGLLYGLFAYTDQHGVKRLTINKAGKWNAPILTFRSQLEARTFVSRMVAESGLCPRLSGLQPGQGPCVDHQLYSCAGVCRGEELAAEYNMRVDAVLNRSHEAGYDGLVLEAGRYPHEVGLVWCERGLPRAFGFLSKRALALNKLDRARFQLLYRNPELEGTVFNWISKRPQEVLLKLPEDFRPVYLEERVAKPAHTQLSLPF